MILDADHRLTAVQVVWVDDDFCSLVMLQDRGFDADGDARLTPEDEVRRSGFAMDWDADIAGDLYVLDKGTGAFARGRPRDGSVRVGQRRVGQGRVVPVHRRDISTPATVTNAPQVIQRCDPTRYTAQTIRGTPPLGGPGAAGCALQVAGPDITEAQQKLQAMLQDYTADQNVAQDSPAVRATVVARGAGAGGGHRGAALYRQAVAAGADLADGDRDGGDCGGLCHGPWHGSDHGGGGGAVGPGARGDAVGAVGRPGGACAAGAGTGGGGGDRGDLGDAAAEGPLTLALVRDYD